MEKKHMIIGFVVLVVLAMLMSGGGGTSGGTVSDGNVRFGADLVSSSGTTTHEGVVYDLYEFDITVENIGSQMLAISNMSVVLYTWDLTANTYMYDVDSSSYNSIDIMTPGKEKSFTNWYRVPEDHSPNLIRFVYDDGMGTQLLDIDL